MSTPLTPHERALAKMLAAWDEMPANEALRLDRNVNDALMAIGDALAPFLRSDQTPNALGKALLARLRSEDGWQASVAERKGRA